MTQTSQTDKKYEKRCVAKYKNLSSRYEEKSKNFNRQYYNIYLKRLEKMTALLVERIQDKFGDKYPVIKLHKLAEFNVEQCIVIGTLFKDQVLKPSILKQLAQSAQVLPQPIARDSTDESDVLYIEDEFQRYAITGDLRGDKVVTGVTCALLGSDDGNGKFRVTECIFADYPAQIERPIPEEDIYVVLISGLNLIKVENCFINLELLKNWIRGNLKLADLDSKSICRVIIAGNSVKNDPEDTKPTISLTSKQPLSNETVEAVKVLDRFIFALSQVIEVDIMPGEFDPSNLHLPQQAFHSCILPEARQYSSLNLVTNPYSCEVDGAIVTGSSGQPIRDILRYSDIDNPLEAMESCLKWRHLAPTAPDTLPCFPFYEEDPFVIDRCPHVFFAGNQEKFATKLAVGDKGQVVRLISIPEFSTSHTVCILNLKNLDCHSILFDS